MSTPEPTENQFADAICEIVKDALPERFHCEVYWGRIWQNAQAAAQKALKDKESEIRAIFAD